MGRNFPYNLGQPLQDPRCVTPGGRPITWGFTAPFIPQPVGGPIPRVKLLTWSSPDGLPHLISLQIFLNNSMDANRIGGVPYIPTAVIACIAQLSWQTDAGTFNAEVDVHFGQTISLVASGLTVFVIEESAPSNIPTGLASGTLNFTAALTIDTAPVSGAFQPQRSFSFFSLAGLGAAGDAILPISVFVPNFSRQVDVVRTNNPPAGVGGLGVFNDIEIRIDTIPFGRRSQHQVGAGGDLGRPIDLFNGATQVTVNSTGNPVGMNIIFLLDL